MKVGAAGHVCILWLFGILFSCGGSAPPSDSVSARGESERVEAWLNDIGQRSKIARKRVADHGKTSRKRFDRLPDEMRRLAASSHVIHGTFVSAQIQRTSWHGTFYLALQIRIAEVVYGTLQPGSVVSLSRFCFSEECRTELSQIRPQHWLYIAEGRCGRSLLHVVEPSELSEEHDRLVSDIEHLPMRKWALRAETLREEVVCTELEREEALKKWL